MWEDNNSRELLFYCTFYVYVSPCGRIAIVLSLSTMLAVYAKDKKRFLL